MNHNVLTVPVFSYYFFYRTANKIERNADPSIRNGVHAILFVTSIIRIFCGKKIKR